jgi:hypothetical protein
LARFQPSLSVTKTRSTNCRQQPGEPLSTFYDAIIELCKQVDRQMPMYMIVDYLLGGVRNDLRIHAKHHLSSITEPLTTGLFLSISRAEDVVQNELSLMQPPSSFSRPNFKQVIAATYRSSPTHHLTPTHLPRSSNQDRSHSVQTYRPLFDLHSFDSSNYQLSWQTI